VALLLAGIACRQREEAPKPAPTPVAPAPKAAAPAGPVVNAEAVARGRYLAESVLGCVSCHTDRDYTRYGGPLRGAALAGACYGKDWGLPGLVCAPNITSDPEHGIGRWTDAELLGALREGYGRDGRTLFPMMPYSEWRTLSDEDARAVVAYLRQVPPVPRSVPRSELPPEVQADIRSLASRLPGPVPGPGADEVARGRYLATIAQCSFCHAGDGEPPQPFAGGLPVPTPYGEETVPHGAVVRGLGEDAFVARFTAWRELAPAPSVSGRVNKLAMPWLSFAGMREEDLRAVYRYLQSLPAPARRGG
jgi:mono/diheme cytochrome c family protein